MSEVKQLPTRDQVKLEDTWDVTTIYASDAAWEEDFKELERLIAASAAFQGTLKNGAKDLFAAIQQLEKVYRKGEKLYVYSHLKNDEDKANATYQALNARAQNVWVKASEALAWFEPELLTLSDEEIQSYIEELDELKLYAHFLNQSIQKRAHVLPKEQEELLASAGEIFGGAGTIFSILDNADLKFPAVENTEGEKVQLSHGVYQQLLESNNREVRKTAFEKYYEVYEQFQNTMAQILSLNVKSHNVNARLHNFSSARQSALSANFIPEAVYDTLVKVVNEKLPLLHRYVALRKKLMGVDELHTYDLYTPIVKEVDVKVTYEEAKEKALKGLAPLGSDYLEKVKAIFDNRIIDVYENQGKRSGAYSSGAYDTAPYILMNWHDSLDQLYTLVHEMGHSMHSKLTRENQPFIYGDYSIFLAEIASTTNENILTEYLLETETDPKVRAYILNHYLDGFKGTVFRQTQFAEFEHFLHTQDAAGVPLTSEMLNEYYADLNARYYGEGLTRDPQIALEWSRIPHFYYNYYVFQYSTGFAAASAMSKKIIEGTQEDLNEYLAYLSAGSSDYPIEVMKKAGVDMTKDDYLLAAFDVFEARLNELEELIE